MGRREVVACIQSAGIQCAHMAWPNGKAPDLPWAVFYLDDSYGFNADDGMYVPKSRWTVELYEAYADEAVESAVESAIQAAFGPFSKYETWVEDEGCLMTVYDFTELEG